MTISYQPKHVDEVRGCLGRMSENSKILGGGTDLIIALDENKEKVDLLCYFGYVTEFKEVELVEDNIYIGAYATMAELESNKIIREYLPAIADAAGEVGSPQIRNNATIGGNISNASPAADMSPVMYLYDAKVEIMNPYDKKMVKIADFFNESGKSILKYNEVVTRIVIPVPTFDSGFIKLGSRQKVTISRIGLALGLKMKDGEPERIRIVIGAISSKAIVVKEAEEYIKMHGVNEEAIIEASTFLSDLMLPDRFYKRYAVKGVLLDVFEKVQKRIK